MKNSTETESTARTSDAVLFPNGTKITYAVEGEMMTGIVYAYNVIDHKYSVKFTNGVRLKLEHNDVQKSYNPVINRRVEKDILAKELAALEKINCDNPIKTIEDLRGRTFLMDVKEDGTRDRAKIINIVAGIQRF